MKTQYKITAALLLLLMGLTAGAQTLQEAKRLTEQEQYEKAKIAFRKLVVAEPTNADNYYFFGDLMVMADDIDSAVVLWNKGADIQPTNPLAHVGKARGLMLTGKNEEGQKSLAQAQAIITAEGGKKGSPLTAQRQAMIYVEMAKANIWTPVPNYDKAIELTNTAERLDNKNAEVLLTRGDALLKKDPVNGSPAIESYKKAAALDPKSAKAWHRIGKLYAAGKNMPDAIKFYNQALSTEPNFAPAFADKGEAFYQLGKYDSASVCYENYLKLNDDPWARYRYTAFLYKSGDHDKAIEQGEKAISQDSTITVLYRIIGKCYLERKSADKKADAAKALMYFDLFIKKQAISGKPKLLADDFIYRGRALSTGGNDSLAVIDYQKGLDMDTARKDIYFDMGTSFFKMKKYGQAAYWYKKKYDAEANSSLTVKVTNLNAYARALYQNKEYTRSDSAYTAIIALDSNLTNGWLGRAQSNGKLDPDGTKELARPYYEKYFAIATATPEAKEKNKKDLINAGLYLASIHLKNKNYACSKAYYLFVQGLDANNDKAKTALEDKDIKAATAAEIGTCTAPKK